MALLEILAETFRRDLATATADLDPLTELAVYELVLARLQLALDAAEVGS